MFKKYNFGLILLFFGFMISLMTFACKRTISDPMLVSKDIFKDMSSTLMKSVSKEAKKEGFPKAVAYCSENANTLIKEKFLQWKEKVKAEHNYKDLKIGRRTQKPRNPKNIAKGESAEILENWAAEGKATPTLREKGNVSKVYYPIKIISETCLKCHGSESQVSKETTVVIAAKYPDDKARNYSLGDLRGLFFVELTK